MWGSDLMIETEVLGGFQVNPQPTCVPRTSWAEPQVAEGTV